MVPEVMNSITLSILASLSVIVVCFGPTTAASTNDIVPALQQIDGGPAQSLGCNMQFYTYRITQSDEFGHECWDFISVKSCFGRCDSNEISDWQFPYKRSYHPVCMHAGRSKAVAMLRNCHPSADPKTRRYEYMEAKGCHCQTCSTTDTSCEAPNNIREESSVKVLALAGPSSDDLDYK